MAVVTIVMGRILLTYPQCIRYNIFINSLVIYRVISNSQDNSKYWHVKWTFRPFKIGIFEKLFLVRLYECVASKSQTNQNGDFDPYAIMYADVFLFFFYWKLFTLKSRKISLLKMRPAPLVVNLPKIVSHHCAHWPTDGNDNDNYHGGGGSY